jgi:hypothetical protein
MERADIGGGIDGEARDLLRRVVRDLFDVHAAFGGSDHRNARGLAIHQQGEINLARDGGAFLDQQAMDLLALRAGLRRDERGAKQALGFSFYLIDRFDDFDSARLAAAAGVDLCLHHPDRAAQSFSGAYRFIGGESRLAARNRHAGISQQRFCLVLVNIHKKSPGESGIPYTRPV